ncbi:MAG: DNA cytosine methyltransferase [Clostridia bacterium]|nr:DNA cytosine methyltransferase [Clostridia bacterium]
MSGIRKGETRSGLYYEGYRILKEKRPNYSIIENVKNLTSKRFKNQFDSILRDLSELGYTNYWQVLNAKNYGIPQNRERVFIISVRNDIAQSGFCFPPKVPLMWKLKDFLEDNVDEKYYLSENAIGKLIKKSNKLMREMQNPDITENSKVKKIIGMYDTENKKHQAGSVYNQNGISPTLINSGNGGNKQPFVLIKQGTKSGYAKAKVGDSINISYPTSTTKRGRVGKEVSQTILTSANIATLEIDKPICINNKNNKLSIQDRVYDIEGISTTILASNFKNKIAEKAIINLKNNKENTIFVSGEGKQYIRIRKLTPLECWRLMGFDDEDFYKAKKTGISNTQLYKQAGNSIVVNVLEYIFEELFNIEKLQRCA